MESSEARTLRIVGECFCGAVGYEAEIDPDLVGMCHCRDCQIFSGSAFRMLGVSVPAKFAFTKGSPRYFDKTADSGRVRRMAFCDICGTHLASLPDDLDAAGALVAVRVATSADFHKLRPAGEVFCDSRVKWLSPVEGTRQYPRMP